MNNQKYETQTISSVLEMLGYIKCLTGNFIYRGQRDESWSLMPVIGRFDVDELGYENWPVFEEDLLEQFRKYSLPYLNHVPNNILEWMIVARHHNLPTRLLDWTTNPLKALFFAVKDKKHKEIDSALWVYDVTMWHEGVSQEVLFNTFEGMKEIRMPEVYYPDHINPRIIAQEGCFTIHPLPETNATLEPVEKLDTFTNYAGETVKGRGDLIKLIIPYSQISSMQRDLIHFGISYKSLFPDLDGVAADISWNLDLWR